jgi:hypothetical protein
MIKGDRRPPLPPFWFSLVDCILFNVFKASQYFRPALHKLGIIDSALERCSFLSCPATCPSSRKIYHNDDKFMLVDASTRSVLSSGDKHPCRSVPRDTEKGFYSPKSNLVIVADRGTACVDPDF